MADPQIPIPQGPGQQPLDPELARLTPQDTWSNWGLVAALPQYRNGTPEYQLQTKQNFWQTQVLAHPGFHAYFQKNPGAMAEKYKDFMQGRSFEGGNPGAAVDARSEQLAATSKWDAQAWEGPGQDWMPDEKDSPFMRQAKIAATGLGEAAASFTSPKQAAIMGVSSLLTAGLGGLATRLGVKASTGLIPEMVAGSRAAAIATDLGDASIGRLGTAALDKMASKGAINLLPETAQAISRYGSAQKATGGLIGMGFGGYMAAGMPEHGSNMALNKGLAVQAEEAGDPVGARYYNDQYDLAKYRFGISAAMAGLAGGAGALTMASGRTPMRPPLDFAPYTPMARVGNILPENLRQMDMPFVPDARVEPMDIHGRPTARVQGQLPIGETSFEKTDRLKANAQYDIATQEQFVQDVKGGRVIGGLPEAKQTYNTLSDRALDSTAKALEADTSGEIGRRKMAQQEILWGPGASFTEGRSRGMMDLPTTGAAGVDAPIEGPLRSIPKNGMARLVRNPALDQTYPFSPTENMGEGDFPFSTKSKTVPGYDVVGMDTPQSAADLFKGSQGARVQDSLVPEAQARTYLNTLQRTMDLDSFKDLPEYAQSAMREEAERLTKTLTEVGTGPYNKKYGTNIAGFLERDPVTHEITASKSEIPGMPDAMGKTGGPEFFGASRSDEAGYVGIKSGKLAATLTKPGNYGWYQDQQSGKTILFPSDKFTHAEVMDAYKYPSQLFDTTPRGMVHVGENSTKISNYGAGDFVPNSVYEDVKSQSRPGTQFATMEGESAATLQSRRLYNRTGDEAGFLKIGPTGKPTLPGWTTRQLEQMGPEEAGKIVNGRMTNAVESMDILGLAKSKSLELLDFIARKNPGKLSTDAANNLVNDFVAHKDLQIAQGTNDMAAARDQARSWQNDTTRRNSFVDNTERGAIDKLPVEDRPVALALWKAAGTQFKAIQDLGTGAMKQFISNYLGRSQYVEKSGSGPGSKRPFEGSKGILQGRSFEYESDARDAGLTPKFPNPIEAMTNKLVEGAKFIMGSKLMQDLDAHDMLHRTDDSATVPAGYAKVHEGTSLFKIGPKGIGGDIYVPKELADALNTYLSPGLAGRTDLVGKIYDPIREGANLANQAALGFSQFHVTTTGINYGVSGVSLAFQKIINRMQNLIRENPRADMPFGDFVRDIGRDAWSATPFGAVAGYGEGKVVRDITMPGRVSSRLQTQGKFLNWMDAQTAKTGPAVLEQTLSTGNYTSLNTLTEALTSGGMRWDRPGEFTSRQRNGMVNDFYMAKSLLSGKMSEMGDVLNYTKGAFVGARAVLRAPFAALEGAAAPIFDAIVPNLKASAALRLMKFRLDQLGPGYTPVEMRQVAHDVVRSIDNRFGQIAYENYNLNKVMKDLGHVSMTSLGWAMGSYDELGGGLYDATFKAGASTAGSLMRGESFKSILANADVSNRLAYTVMLPVVVGMYGAVLHRMIHDKWPEHIMDAFFIPDLHGGTLQLASYMTREVLPVAHGLKFVAGGEYERGIQSLRNHATGKISPFIRGVGEMLGNPNFWNEQTWEDDKPLSGFKRLAEQFIPFNVSNAAKINFQGGNWADQTLNQAAVTSGPAWAHRTDAADLARYYMVEKYPRGPQDAQTVQERKYVNMLRGQLANGRADEQLVLKAQEDGHISLRESQNILSTYTKTDLERDFTNLDLKQMLHVWTKMSPEEQTQTESILGHKFASSWTTMSGDTKRDIRSAYGPLVDKMWGRED